jgi:hypothetical protein
MDLNDDQKVDLWDVVHYIHVFNTLHGGPLSWYGSP